MRISDWSSDVCSSDLCAGRPPRTGRLAVPGAGGTDRQKRTSLKKPKPHGRTNSDRVDMPDGAGRTPVPQSATIQSSKPPPKERFRSEEHTPELQSLMRISYDVCCLKNKRRSTNK